MTPSDYPTLSTAITVRDAARAIEFYKKVFGARERMRLAEPSGKVGHAELEFGTGGLLMLSDPYPEWTTLPEEVGGKSTAVLHLYVDDVDATVERAVAEGAEVVIPVANQFYGDRSGRIRDPFGHLWAIATRVENMSLEEMKRRFAEMAAQ